MQEVTVTITTAEELDWEQMLALSRHIQVRLGQGAPNPDQCHALDRILRDSTVVVSCPEE
jgi:hypothetical protein